MSARIHATSVAIGGDAVLLIGPSGSGKSDLALRLIDRGAALVSDDYSEVTAVDGALIVSAPPTIAGRIEVPGVGVVSLPHRDDVAAALIVQLGGKGERLPDPETEAIEGIALPVIRIDGYTPAAPIKVEFALAKLVEGRA